MSESEVPGMFYQLLRDAIDAWVEREKQKARAQGRTMLGSYFREQLAARIGVVPRQLDRYCSGESPIPAERLIAIIRHIEDPAAVKYLARECRVGVYDLVPPERARLTDHVRATAHMLREVGEATSAVMDLDHAGGKIPMDEGNRACREIEGAIAAMQRVLGMLLTRMGMETKE
jgi:DNA-binding transcriptional regulator YdaS (Cro superfamily)